LPAKESLTQIIREAVEVILAEKATAASAAPGSSALMPPTMGGFGSAAFQSGMPPYPIPQYPVPPYPAIFSSGQLPHHVLLRWPWVDADTVNLIQLGKFDIDALPKLHQSDQLRNAYVKKSVKGILQPMDGSPAEVLIGTTKLQASFKDPNTFFLAWLIYVSIRVSYHLERAPGLILWTEPPQSSIKQYQPGQTDDNLSHIPWAGLWHHPAWSIGNVYRAIRNTA
jgi:hypothetical protein